MSWTALGEALRRRFNPFAIHAEQRYELAPGLGSFGQSAEGYEQRLLAGRGSSIPYWSSEPR
jgi:hypothetical protein